MYQSRSAAGALLAIKVAKTSGEDAAWMDREREEVVRLLQNTRIFGLI